MLTAQYHSITGYSVLGWNHPGFGGSTGTPLPDQEANAIDTVMQFAINKYYMTKKKVLKCMICAASIFSSLIAQAWLQP